MFVIKIKQSDCSNVYYLDSIGSRVITTIDKDEARQFHNQSKAKLEMLKLILDYHIPRNLLLLEN
jgi:hypothetical protein